MVVHPVMTSLRLSQIPIFAFFTSFMTLGNFGPICSLFFGISLAYGHSETEYFRVIPNGAIVEGSARFSGLQPDYLIDTEAEEFNSLFRVAESIRQSKDSIPEKVSLLVQEVRRVFSRHHDYDDPVYLDLLAQYRKKGTEIPLSKYVQCGAGVCRENSLILHLLMRHAGISNFHIYAKIMVAYDGANPVSEDHGFVIFKFRNERWIADSYFKQFNGYSFDEFIDHQSELRVPLRKLPFAVERFERRTIVELNSYPKYFVPKNDSCQILFSQ